MKLFQARKFTQCSAICECLWLGLYAEIFAVVNKQFRVTEVVTA